MSISFSLRSSRIGIKIAFFSFVFSTIWIILISGIIFYFEYNTSKKNILNKILEVGETQSAGINKSLWDFDTQLMEAQLNAMVQLPWICHSLIREKSGRLWQAGAPSPEDHWTVSFPIEYPTRGGITQIGVLEITPDFGPLKSGIKLLLLKTLAFHTLTAFVIAVVILILFYVLAGRPLSKIAAQAGTITIENLDRPIRSERKIRKGTKDDELDILETALNDMRTNLIQAFKKLKTSEERLEMALAGANDGIWDWNLKTSQIHFDDRYFTMLGYEPNEFQSSFESWEKRVHADDINRVKTDINRYISGEIDAYIQEYRMINKNGDYQWIRAKGEIAVRDNDNTPLRFIGTHQDITDRKQAEEEIKSLRNYLANIIDSMPSVIIGVDREGLVTQWNNRAWQITGISQESAKGQPLEKAYPFLGNELVQIKKSIELRQVCFDPRQPRKEKKQTRYEDITIYPLVANGVEGAVIRVDDVTEQVRLEEMMIQSEKMLSVGGLAAGMAHEINNPLAGMLQTAHILKLRLGDPAMPANLKAAGAIGVSMNHISTFMEKRGIFRMVDAIVDSGKRVADIVNNMLSFARKTEASFSSHAPDRLLDQIIELASTDYDLKKAYDFKTIKIIKDYEENLPAVPCEKSKIQQVLLNVLRNGAQAMTEQPNAKNVQPCFTLRLLVEKKSRMLRMEIEDNGPGMDAKTQSRVFEPFFTTKPVGVGTGLGLSVSYFIITQNHGGTMDVVSTPGKGSTFIIRLPLVRDKNNFSGE